MLRYDLVESLLEGTCLLLSAVLQPPLNVQVNILLLVVFCNSLFLSTRHKLVLAVSAERVVVYCESLRKYFVSNLTPEICSKFCVKTTESSQDVLMNF